MNGTVGTWKGKVGRRILEMAGCPFNLMENLDPKFKTFETCVPWLPFADDLYQLIHLYPYRVSLVIRIGPMTPILFKISHSNSTEMKRDAWHGCRGITGFHKRRKYRRLGLYLVGVFSSKKSTTPSTDVFSYKKVQVHYPIRMFLCFSSCISVYP